jgi:hypothetical protein
MTITPIPFCATRMILPTPTWDFLTTRGNPTAYNPDAWRDRDKRDFRRDRDGSAGGVAVTDVARERQSVRL